MFKDLRIKELEKEIEILKVRENDGIEETEQLKHELTEILN